VDQFIAEMTGGYFDTALNKRAPKTSSEYEDFRQYLQDYLVSQKED
jgi:hypothetical protein